MPTHFMVLFGNLKLLHGLIIVFDMEFSKFDKIHVNEKIKLNVFI